MLAPGRCGTNHLVRLLERFPNVISRGEIFNNETAWGLEKPDVRKLSEKFGLPFRDIHDPKLVAFLKRRPVETLATICDAMPDHKTVLTTKILTHQLNFEKISELFDSELTISALFVRRRVIDIFISLTKAELLKEWVDVDTTALRPKLDIAAFERFFNWQQTWHTAVVDILARHAVRPLTLEYETDIDCDDDSCLENFARIAGRGLFPKAPGPGKGAMRQDRNLSRRHKVENWEEFVAELQRKNLHDKAMSPFEV